MEEEFLSPGLAELERRLGGGGVAANPALRGRVLGAVGENLAPLPRSSMSGGFLAGVAAVVLIGLSLSMVADSVTRFGVPMQSPSGEVAATSEALHRLVPDLTRQEADQMALAAAARGRGGWSAVPELRGSADRLMAEGAVQ
jgi:hypothetical protein